MRYIYTYNNIKIKYYITGQCNKLIGNFCGKLCEINNDFKIILVPIYQEWYEFKNNQYNLINYKFKYTLYDIYEKWKSYMRTN